MIYHCKMRLFVPTGFAGKHWRSGGLDGRSVDGSGHNGPGL